MRKVLHLDINSYFASMEQQAYPNLRGRPIGVAGKGRGERTVITGASREAKKLGVDSAMSTWEALRICPQLIIVPADYDRYLFTSQRIFRLLERFGPKVDIFSIDEAFLDLGEEISWADAEVLAREIKKLLSRQIGRWVTGSIGISYGKTLAKLASEMQKPDGLTVIRPENFAAIAERTPIEKLCGIGYRLRPRLNRMGITTIAQMGAAPLEMLVEVFGPHTGTWMHRIGNGQDDNILRSFRELPQEKSIGHSYTLPQDVHGMKDVKKVLLLLSERVGVRLRKKGLVGRTVSTYLRFYDRTGWGERQAQKEYLLDGYQIYQAAERLIDAASRRSGVVKPVRLVAVTISDLAASVQTTAPLLVQSQAKEQLVHVVDKINDRYGEWTVHRGVLNRLRSRIFNLPDGRNKRSFVPQITRINPFTKRV